jgi:hypothetical protein
MHSTAATQGQDSEVRNWPTAAGRDSLFPTQNSHRLLLTDRLVPYEKQTVILPNQLALPAKRSH